MLGEGLGASFRVLARSGWALAGLSLAVFIPTDLAGALIDETLGWGDSSVLQLLAVTAIVVAGASLASGAAISFAHTGAHGAPSPAGSLRQGLRRWPTLLLLSLISCVAIVAGLVLLVIPGLVLTTWWFLSYPAAMLEGETAIGALGRSRALVRGAFWPTFVVAVPLVVVYVALAYGGWRIGFGIAENVLGAGVGSAVGDALGTALWAAFATGWFDSLRAQSARAA